VTVAVSPVTQRLLDKYDPQPGPAREPPPLVLEPSARPHRPIGLVALVCVTFGTLLWFVSAGPGYAGAAALAMLVLALLWLGSWLAGVLRSGGPVQQRELHQAPQACAFCGKVGKLEDQDGKLGCRNHRACADRINERLFWANVRKKDRQQRAEEAQTLARLQAEEQETEEQRHARQQQEWHAHFGPCPVPAPTSS
jgi:hypothetical protein